MNATRISPIRNDEDHAAALARIEQLMNARPGTPEMDELEVRSQLVESYEQNRWPIERPSPIEAIRYRMDQQGLRQRDLAPYIGSASKVSEVLNGRRPLTLKMIRALHRNLGIPAEVLVGDSDLSLTEHSLDVDCDKYPWGDPVVGGWFERFGKVNGREEEALRWLIGRAGVSGTAVSAYCRKNDGARRNAKMDWCALNLWCMEVFAEAAEAAPVAPYRAGALTAEVLRHLAMFSAISEGPVLVRKPLAQLGIRLVVVQHPKRTYLDGAALLAPDGNPVVALTLRYDRVDSFWHTLVHELSHVKNDLGDGASAIYDDLDLPATDDEAESRADREAAEALIPHGLLPDSAAALAALSTKDVERIALSANVHPAVVAGRIRHMTSNWRRFSHLVAGQGVRDLFAPR